MTVVTFKVTLGEDIDDTYTAVLLARERLKAVSTRGIVEDRYSDIDRQIEPFKKEVR